MSGRSKIGSILTLIPGKQRFGIYRFLPFFVILGGAMEWFMINVRIGKETFLYNLFKRTACNKHY
ncbi:small integral membrane protein 4-like, partial [Bombina bombina]|uniref:small integral membrane protein 4-like n=1 Tax=Bombina bombina TaxID=8345 RepID=UPI00235AE84F